MYASHVTSSGNVQCPVVMYIAACLTCELLLRLLEKSVLVVHLRHRLFFSTILWDDSRLPFCHSLRSARHCTVNTHSQSGSNLGAPEVTVCASCLYYYRPVI